jgi:hypothetical protein
MRRSFVCVLLFLFLITLSCISQQTDVREYSTFTAFSYLSTPSLNLVQRGFDTDFGVNLRSWLTLGGDFSYGNGGSTLLPNDLNSATKAKLAPYLPLFQHLGIPVALPYTSTTYTYEAGPQFNYRRFRKFTFFARPALGALHATTTVHPNNPLIAQIASGLLGSSLKASDTVVFYGAGGGITWEATPNFGIRVATDFVHYNFFSNMLDGGRNSVRVTVGTKFSFGKNILKRY